MTPENLAWCRNLVESLRHGGLWGFPDAGLVFRLDKINKRLVLIEGDGNTQDFAETRRNFECIGWEVTDS